MLEVLVSLAILAFGLLGVAGLQVVAMRNTHSADSRSTALYLAYEIIDRIHANPYSCAQGTAAPVQGAAGFPGDCYDYNTTSGSYNFTLTTVPAATCLGVSANCTADAVAKADLWDWLNKVNALLPRGEAIVCNDSTPVDGKPSWASATSNRAQLYGCDGAAVAATDCVGCSAVGPVLTVKIWWDDRINTSATSAIAGDRGASWRRLYLTFQP